MGVWTNSQWCFTMASSKSWILVTCLVVTAVVDARTFFQNGRFGKRIIDTNQPLASLLTGPISSLLLHDKFDKDDSFRLYDKRPERFFFGNRYGKRNSFKRKFWMKYWFLKWALTQPIQLISGCSSRRIRRCLPTSWLFSDLSEKNSSLSKVKSIEIISF